MEISTSKPLGFLSSNSQTSSTFQDFNTLFNNLNTTLLSTSTSSLRRLTNTPCKAEKIKNGQNFSPKRILQFSSTSISIQPEIKNPENPTSRIWLKPASRGSPQVYALFKNLSVLEKALMGAAGGGIAGAFTYVCLHPLDTIKTKLQTKGASEIYSGTVDAIVKTFKTRGILGFYSGVSAVIVGSTASSAVYFGTCEFGKSVLSEIPQYPAVLIPPTAGAMGNIVSSAIMVPKELITQRMQAGAKGRSWEVLLKILKKDGILGLYAGYSATLLRNLPAGVLSYSSFEYLKAAVLNSTHQVHLEPFQSVCCGALAGAISASLTTPLDVVKTRLMTQVHGEAVNKVAAVMYSGVSATVKQILKEEGWIGFTRGMGPRVVHSACFSAIGYFAFETARLTILHQYLKQKELQNMALDSSSTVNQSE
ncbi:protein MITOFERRINLIKE 1, chloroplastic-like [Coffea arabica]|uniref:Protein MITOFERRINLIKE 1, chloroplastic-like n=1 Tax=Coffea arabica TaxID=13443 RepID=A0A6P6UYK7_COFAR|nr:protein MITOFERRINLIKE 1, chloroplastic-like [Coffea arabica]XP_027094667.1 protein MITOFERRINLIKE 1, chloroplastic-like [Coffea arabica]XP_027094668.1 protein MITOFERRINLIKE 1, chloroplastic-like [Coffea arabica]XP_027094669.1 protein MITOFERRINLIKE 1, chloroplastic-like [Coffea arabica]XP_027094670.1 protein MITOFERRINLIKE 1, chloroplastic-like [Coffea arabica]XP_027094671.1 protein MITOFERRINLIKE 1, chloroplastic-like [Coffea arabica]